jgi:hypothetical protein
VGRTLDANNLLARSACGKRRGGRPLNELVSHHSGGVVLVDTKKTSVIAALAFAAGVCVANLPRASAEEKSPSANLSEKTFMVSIDEVAQNFVFAERFKGSYFQTVKMSDGSTRTIKLTPMLHNGMQVVELNDNGGITYMGLNGSTTNGRLMVQLRDIEELQRQLKEQGFKVP